MLSAKDLLQLIPQDRLHCLIDSNTNLKGILTGYLAEEILIDQLKNLKVFDLVEKIPDNDSTKGDIRIKYQNKTFTIEVKCMRPDRSKQDLLLGGITSSVSIGSADAEIFEDGSRTFCMKDTSYDILAICTLIVTGEPKYYFIHSKYIPRSEDFPDRFNRSLPINTYNTPCLRSDIFEVIKDLD